VINVSVKNEKTTITNVSSAIDTNTSLKDFASYCKQLTTYLNTIPDPRVNSHNINYSISDILLQTILATLSGNISCRENFDFGVNNFGTSPSKSTLNRVIGMIDPNYLNKALTEWWKHIFTDLPKLPHIAIDGKRLKNYKPNEADSCLIHINALVCDMKFTISSILSEKTKGSKIRYPLDREECKKLNSTRELPENEAFRVMIEEISTQICKFVVTGDCLHLSVNTLHVLKDKNIDFLFGVKNNTPKLLEFLINKSILISSYETKQSRISKSIEIYQIPEIIDTQAANHKDLMWNSLNLRCFIKVTSLDSKKRKVTVEQRMKSRSKSIKKGKVPNSKNREGAKEVVRYYVTSLDYNTAPESLVELIQSHWQIENNNHRERDVTFQEDNRHMKNPRLVKNIALLLNNTLNLIYTKTDKSIKQAIKKYTNRLDLCLDLLRDG
jgi:predicted transposase YbfD/YdcC